MKLIDKLHELPADVVEMQIRQPDLLIQQVTPELRDFILQIDAAGKIIRSGECMSTRKMAEQLQMQYPALSFRTCQNRIADALSVLYKPTNNTAEQWQLFFADKMMQLAEQNMQAGNLSEARRCIESAKSFTEQATSARVDERLTEYKPLLISPDVTPERMGYDKRGLKELRRNALKMLDGLDLSTAERERLTEEIEAEIQV